MRGHGCLHLGTKDYNVWKKADLGSYLAEKSRRHLCRRADLEATGYYRLKQDECTYRIDLELHKTQVIVRIFSMEPCRRIQMLTMLLESLPFVV